jgi:hypothetical protein
VRMLSLTKREGGKRTQSTNGMLKAKGKL